MPRPPESMRALALLQPLLALLSPGGARGRLSILLYHRVHRSADPLAPGDPDAAAFRWQMELLAARFTPLALAEAVPRLLAGTLPPRAVCVTFDDGYADNIDVALPILRAAGVPATFFIATGYLDGGRMFNDTVIEIVRRLPHGPVDLAFAGLDQRWLHGDDDRRALAGALIARLKYQEPAARAAAADELAERLGVELPPGPMMTSAQVQTLAAAGMEIGAHTDSHPILARIDRAAARAEIRRGRDRLTALTGRRPALFAYPNGRAGRDYTTEHAALVRALGFTAAVATDPGAAASGTDPFRLPRFTPWDRTPLRFGARLASNLATRPAATAGQGRGHVPGP